MSGPTGPRRDPGEHGEWEALAVGWALSALEPHDEARFAVHLPGCDRCTETVRESLRTVADLAYAVPDEAPPPALKTRILEAAAAEPRRPPERGRAGLDSAGGPGEGEWPLGNRRTEPGPAGPDAADWFARPPATPADPADPAGPRPQAAAGTPPAGEGPGRAGPGVEGGRGPGPDGRGRHAAPDDGQPAATPPGPPPNVVPLDSRRRRWTRRIAVAAVVALIAALGAWNLQLRSEQDDLRRVVAQRDVVIEQLTAGGPARVAALTADGKPSPQRRATVVVRGDRIEIITEGLDTSDQVTYWLWTLKCDVTDLEPVRGFQLTESRFSVQSIGSDADAAGAPCFAVSEELGSARPTTPREVVAVGAAR